MTDAAPASLVFLRDLTVEARIGYYAHEKASTQPLVVTIELTLDVARFEDEDLAGTVDYTALAADVHALAARHVDLIESFAERLAAQCLARPHVRTARVRIAKPNAVPNAIAGVEIVRRR